MNISKRFFSIELKKNITFFFPLFRSLFSHRGRRRALVVLLKGTQFSIIIVRLTREVNFRKRCRLWEEKKFAYEYRKRNPPLSLSLPLPPHVYTRFNIIREKSAAIEFLLSVESSNSASCQNFHFTEIKKYIISRL